MKKGTGARACSCRLSYVKLTDTEKMSQFPALSQQRTRWSIPEETTLVDAILDRESRLFGSMHGCGSQKLSKVKNSAWQEVADILNRFDHTTISIHLNQYIIIIFFYYPYPTNFERVGFSCPVCFVV